MLRASAGASRGAFLLKSTFFTSVTDFFLIWPPPRPPRSALGLLLGALWGPMDALGTSLGVSKDALERSRGPFWVALGGSWVTFKALKDPRTPQGLNLEPYLGDSVLIVKDFQNISTLELDCKPTFAMVCITRCLLYTSPSPRDS